LQSLRLVRRVVELASLGGMKRIPVIIGFLFVICLGWGIWIFQPWMATGRAVYIGTWRFGTNEFQVWQRKTDIPGEPFATGLFVRAATNQWQVFCINIDDFYSPSVQLRVEGDSVSVFKSGEKVAVFDMVTQSYRRGPLQAAHTPVLIRATVPPGDWWLRL
jgi:hypothetical protein